MALILAFAGGPAIWQRTVPVRSTSLVQPPLLSTSPTHSSPPILFFSFPFVRVWCGGLLTVYFVPVWEGLEVAAGMLSEGSRHVGDTERADLPLLSIIP